MTRADIESVLAWRNHEEVRRFMYTQHVISKDEHSRWFDRASIDPKRHLLIYQVGDKALGFINIHEVAAGVLQIGVSMRPQMHPVAQVVRWGMPFYSMHFIR